MVTCKDCNGKGMRTQTVRTILGNMQTQTTCSTCNGEGESPKQSCTTCHGEGVQRKQRSLRVTIPAGVDDGAMLRVRGEGEAVKGGTSGDLYIRVHVEDDPRFERDGRDIHSRISIGFTQAALGDMVEVETVDGPVELKIPEGIQSGTPLRLRGKGIAGGDQLVFVEVMTPKKLSREQKKMLEEL